jgi:C4-dicarboxylate transporter, DctQ subunit
MAALLGAIAAVVLFEVCARYFFNRPTIWAVDFTEYALVYLAFFGSAWVLRDHAHVRVDLLIEHLPVGAALALTAVTYVISAAVMWVFAWVGGHLVWEAYVKNQAMLKAWPVPRWIILLPIPMASAMMTIEFLRQAWQTLSDWRRGGPAQVPLKWEPLAASDEEKRVF